MPELFHWPINPRSITQRFGENNVCVSFDGSKVISCDGNNPPEGYKSVYGTGGHTGIDLRATHGQEVYAAQQGRIYATDTNPRTGLDIRLEHEIDGRRFRTIYEHLLGYQGKVGDFVKTGQLIGWADNTGKTTGTHLHFQVEEFIGGKWKWIDPLPLMSDHYAKDVLRWVDTLKWATEQVALLADRIGDYLRNHSRPKSV